MLCKGWCLSASPQSTLVNGGAGNRSGSYFELVAGDNNLASCFVHIKYASTGIKMWLSGKVPEHLSWCSCFEGN